MSNSESSAEQSVKSEKQLTNVSIDIKFGLFELFMCTSLCACMSALQYCVCTLSPSICSMSLSRVGIQLGARWQFWKKTHRPRSIASFIMLSAIGPW